MLTNVHSNLKRIFTDTRFLIIDVFSIVESKRTYLTHAVSGGPPVAGSWNQTDVYQYSEKEHKQAPVCRFEDAV
jgi:hypothetical protein